MRKFADWRRQAQAKHGDRLSTSDLAVGFIYYFENGDRIKVRTTYPSGEVYERSGTVGITTGWRPVFLLMHRSNAHGSSDVLNAKDQIIAVKRGRQYIAV